MAAATLLNGVAPVVAGEIIEGTTPAGEVLSLAGIQARFGISRTVAREVMRRLESVGLLRSSRRVGLVVQPSSEWHVLDPQVIEWRLAGRGRDAQLRSLTELRAAVEPLAVAAATQNASAAQKRRIRDLAATLESTGASGDMDAFLEADIEFHGLLLRASGNELFAALAEVFAVTLAGRVHHGLMPSHPLPAAIAAHVAVAAAMDRSSSTDAFEAMVGMLSGIRTELFGN
jgi:DNA-binding FadR family transcriptional regulator